MHLYSLHQAPALEANMRLTVLSDYSLRVLMYLGIHDDRLCTISEIAQAYGISENHLMKVVNRLGQDGFIETMRGRGGGLRTRQAPRVGLAGRSTSGDGRRFPTRRMFR